MNRSGCTSTRRTPGSPRWFPGTNGSCAGAEHADSLVVNPHKWLFTPFDLCALYCRRMDVVRAAFALTPDYLEDRGGRAGPQPDGHRRAARAPLPRAQAVDGAAPLRRRRPARAARRAHAAGAALRASGSTPTPHSSGSRRCRSVSCASGRCGGSGDPDIDAFNERLLEASTAAARSSSRTRASTAGTRCGWRSAICTRPNHMSRAPGNCCGSTPRLRRTAELGVPPSTDASRSNPSRGRHIACTLSSGQTAVLRRAAGSSATRSRIIRRREPVNRRSAAGFAEARRRRDMSLRKLFMTASLVALTSAAAPGQASADWLFTPFVGGTFGGSANIGGVGEDFDDEFERKLNYGASLAFMGGGAWASSSTSAIRRTSSRSPRTTRFRSGRRRQRHDA